MVDRPARDAILVEASGEMEALEQELDRGRDDSWFLSAANFSAGLELSPSPSVWDCASIFARDSISSLAAFGVAALTVHDPPWP